MTSLGFAVRPARPPECGSDMREHGRVGSGPVGSGGADPDLKVVV